MKFEIRRDFNSWELYFLLFSATTALQSIAMGGLSWTPEFPAFNISDSRWLWLASLVMRLVAPFVFIWFRRAGICFALFSWLLFLGLFHGTNAELAQLEPLLAFAFLAAGRDAPHRRATAILFFAILFFFSGLSKLNGPFLAGDEWRTGEMIYPSMPFLRQVLTALPNPWTGLAIALGEMTLGILWIFSPRRALVLTVGFVSFVLGTFAGRVTATQIFAVLFAMIFDPPWAWTSVVGWLFLLPSFLTFGIEKQHEIIFTAVFVVQVIAMVLWLRSRVRDNPQALQPIFGKGLGLSRRVLLTGIVLASLPAMFYLDFLPVPYGFSIFSGHELIGREFLRVSPAEICLQMPKNLRHGYRVNLDKSNCCLQVPNVSAAHYQMERLNQRDRIFRDVDSCLAARD